MSEKIQLSTALKEINCYLINFIEDFGLSKFEFSFNLYGNQFEVFSVKIKSENGKGVEYRVIAGKLNEMDWEEEILISLYTGCGILQSFEIINKLLDGRYWIFGKYRVTKRERKNETTFRKQK
jgi:hypothetical protein